MQGKPLSVDFSTRHDRGTDTINSKMYRPGEPLSIVYFKLKNALRKTASNAV